MTGVDASELAVERQYLNSKLNGMEDRVKFICRDVFDFSRNWKKKGRNSMVVILDPPAFTKSRNSVKNAVKGYREINLRAMKLVRDGGFLATCSCSHFMTYELFTQTIHQAGKKCPQTLQSCRVPAPRHRITRFCGRQKSPII